MQVDSPGGYSSALSGGLRASPAPARASKFGGAKLGANKGSTWGSEVSSLNPWTISPQP